jgi:ribosomal protein S18 acetylase RimI-like enzyme
MLTIRPATPADAAQMGRVHVQVWRETYPGIVPQHVLDAMSEEQRAARWAQVLTEKKPDEFFFAAFDGKALAGFCGGGPRREAQLGTDVEIFMINILRSYHGNGIGRRLISAVASHLTTFKSIGLWVFVENHNARAFYRRLGGVETDIRQDVDFQGDKCPEMAVHWAEAKTLAAGKR